MTTTTDTHAPGAQRLMPVVLQNHSVLKLDIKFKFSKTLGLMHHYLLDYWPIQTPQHESMQSGLARHAELMVYDMNYVKLMTQST